MPKLWRASIIALLAALFAIFLGRQGGKPPADEPEPIRGRNEGTILFFALAESGQINVQLAATQALLEKNPNVDVHFASFPSVRDKVARVSSFARGRSPSVHEVAFHEIQGIDRPAALLRGMNCTELTSCLAHAPGARGAAVLAQQLEFALWPWTGEEHMAIFERSIELIEKVDPALVVVDFAFRPVMDAVEHLNRHHAIITPLALADIFAMSQPNGAGLWKYPAMGTGFSFPVPWYQIPENLYVNFRLLYNIIMKPSSAATSKYLRERGIGSQPLHFRPGVPFITQTLPGASIPVDVLPDSITCAGAILLESGTAAEQDPELVSWVLKAPTIVVNLGSLFKYTQERAKIMAEAIHTVLANTDIQVLWKVSSNIDLGDDFATSLTKYLSRDRVRITDWFTVDTLPLLQIDNVIASIHHGGSSSYNEAVAAGVPQVVIPIWEDHYNFAQLVEDLGLGLYATRGTAPEWTVAGIAEPILRVVGQSAEGTRMREKAKEIGKLAQETPGRYIAAAKLVELATSGPG